MNSAARAKPIVRYLCTAALVLGVWGALVLLFAVPLALTSSGAWHEAIRFGASFWALWLLFLPLTAWLAFRFPTERKNLLRNVGLHLLTCLLVVGANRAALRAFSQVWSSANRSETPGQTTHPRAGMEELQKHQRHVPASPPRSPDRSIKRLGPPAAFGVFLGLRAALDVLVYWALVGVCNAIRIFRISQERERRAAELEAMLTGAKLQSLRMQMNPHFLFNTLNSIAALVYVNPRAADEMLGDLSELLRRSLDSMEEQEIPLAEEIEFIGAYLRIEKKRFGDRLRLEISVPGELGAALVPAFILQPLVENAIRHGIEPRRGPGLISIEAKREGNHLQLIVRDNGRGLPAAGDTSATRGGIGLANTRARLEGLYGKDHKFTFGNGEPAGCLVYIYLPFHLDPLQVPTFCPH